MDFVERTKDVAAANLITDKITNHEGCYANIANIATLEYANKQKKNGCMNPLKVANLCHKAKSRAPMWNVYKHEKNPKNF